MSILFMLSATIVPPMSIIRVWIIVPLLHVVLFCCCLWCLRVIVDWNSTILCDVSWLSTSVAHVLCLFSFVSLTFTFALLLSFVSKRIAISNWTFSIVVTLVSFSFALVSSVALSFSFAFSFVLAFSFVTSVSFTFDCWYVHWCCSSTLICSYAWGSLLLQFVECCCCSVVFHDCCSDLIVVRCLSS